MNRMRAALPFLTVLALVMTGCAKSTTATEKPQDDQPPGSNAGTTGTQQSDWAAIEKLEAEAKNVAKISGCDASGDCRAAPVGSRACGGPRYYIPYCARTTDSVALYRKLDEVAAAEREYNRKNNVMSTCEFRMAPTVESVGGSCVAR